MGWSATLLRGGLLAALSLALFVHGASNCAASHPAGRDLPAPSIMADMAVASTPAQPSNADSHSGCITAETFPPVVASPTVTSIVPPPSMDTDVLVEEHRGERRTPVGEHVVDLS